MKQDFIIKNSKTLEAIQIHLGVTFLNILYSNTGQIIISVDPSVGMVVKETLQAWEALQGLKLIVDKN